MQDLNTGLFNSKMCAYSPAQEYISPSISVSKNKGVCAYPVSELINSPLGPPHRMQKAEPGCVMQITPQQAHSG